MNEDEKLQLKIQTFYGCLNEKQKRLFLASEAEFIGRGGIKKIHDLTGVSKITISKGVKELKELSNSEDKIISGSRIRKPGGGRKKAIDNNIWRKIKFFIEPHTKGDPENPLQWISKSLRKIEAALKEQEIHVSHRIIGDVLKRNGFSLKSNKKRFEGKTHCDRDKQFEYINKKVIELQKNNQPVISVDAKKREMVGNFKNTGAEWSSKGNVKEVNAYDFLTEADGIAIPYGVYDIASNKGWVNVGITKDTAQFAVQSIRNWWYSIGIATYNTANSLMICADGGGSNSSRGRLWKYELQKLSDELGITIQVAHYPPGTSKWNKIEYKLFSYISKNWRGVPLESYEIIVNMISSTRTTTGLTVDCEMDKNNYETGIKISDDQMKEINISRSEFHGEWNYSISPKM